MNNWVLLEHKIYSANSLDIHYDFLVENGIDCLTWKFLQKLDLIMAVLKISMSNNLFYFQQENRNEYQKSYQNKLYVQAKPIYSLSV